MHSKTAELYSLSLTLSLSLNARKVREHHFLIVSHMRRRVGMYYYLCLYPTSVQFNREYVRVVHSNNIESRTNCRDKFISLTSWTNLSANIATDGIIVTYLLLAELFVRAENFY